METSANVSSSELCEYKSIESMNSALLFLYLALLPLFLCVAYVAHERRQKRRPFSHSDVFTFNIVGTETLAIGGSVVYTIGAKFGAQILMGTYLFIMGNIGEMCFHCLTCLDRYLAVVHPIAYLRLKERGGVAVRNGAVAGAWGLSVGCGILQFAIPEQHGISGICQTSLGVLFLVVVAFCSVSVLRVLIRPGPGEGGGDSRRVDPSKQRAFVTITAILGVLLLRLVVFGADYLMKLLHVLAAYDSCVLSLISSFINFPSSLVLPLMFLQKYGKLPKWSITSRKP